MYYFLVIGSVCPVAAVKSLASSSVNHTLSLLFAARNATAGLMSVFLKIDFALVSNLKVNPLSESP